MSQASQLSRRKRISFKVVALVISLGVAFALLEVGSRLVESRSQTRGPTEYLKLFEDNPNQTGSYRLRPNLDLAISMGGRSIRIRTNSHGMPWREVGFEKTGRQRRIAFLGDSFTFGSWADSYATSFVGVVDSELSPERWDVLNFGVGGYGLGDVELLLHEQVMAFSPTYVVVVLFAGNDLRDTYLGIDKERIVDGTAHLDDTKVRAKVPEKLLIEDTTVVKPCRRESFLLRGLDAFSSFRLLSPHIRLENLCIDFAVNHNFTMYTFWSQHPYPPVALEAKDAAIATLDHIDKFLQSHRARLAVAVIPMMEQVNARESQGPDFDIAYPQAHIQIFARQRSLPYLDLLPVLREHVIRTNERLYWKDDPHLNNRGHEIVGKAMSEWFRCCVRNVRPGALEPEPPIGGGTR